MNALVLTHQGVEQISAQELKNIITVSDVQVLPGMISFSCKDEQDLVDLCYKGRTFQKVVRVLQKFSCGQFPLPNFESLPYVDKTAVVVCERIGVHAFTSFDVEKELNAALGKKYGVTIDHKVPQTTFFLLVQNNECVFGVDFSGVDLGRRDYRIFLGTDSLKGTIAASLLFFAG